MTLKRRRNSLGPIIGYHGCNRDVAEKVLNNKEQLKPSENDYDWLGPGVYFWMDSQERGMEWAVEQQKRGNIKDPYVIGAYINLGLCLNLTDYGAIDEVLLAYNLYREIVELTGSELPKNLPINGTLLVRRLDCAVIKTLHELREETGDESYDTVFGVFEEGDCLYDGAGFKRKTHVQVAVRNMDCIIGYFRVPEL